METTRRMLQSTYPQLLRDALGKYPSVYALPRTFCGMYGMDFLPLRDGEMKVLEVNLMPSLDSSNTADHLLKTSMLRHYYGMVGFHRRRAEFDPRLNGDDWARIFPAAGLTVHEKRVLMQVVDEDSRRGRFRRVLFRDFAEGQYNSLLERSEALIRQEILRAGRKESL